MRPSRILVAALLLAAAAATPATAQAPADTAALLVRNRHVVTFRTSHLGRPPAARVSGARDRLERALQDRRPGDSVAVAPLDGGRAILIGGRRIFVLQPGDVDPLDATDLDAATAAAAGRLAAAWATLLEERSPRRLARSVGLALVATGVFVLVLALLRRLTSAIRVLTERKVGARAAGLRVGGIVLLQPGYLRVAAARAVIALGWAVGLFAAYLWLTFILRRFPWTRAAGEALGGFLLRTVADMLGGIGAAIPGLLVILIIFAVTRWFSGVVRGFFLAIQEGRAEVPWLHRDTAEPTRRIVGATIWLFAVVAAYPYLPGSDSAVFKGLSVLAGLMLSLGSGSLIGQAMSGLALMYSRALRPGDFVRIDDVEGAVTTLGMFSTKLRTPRGEEVTIPNGVVLGTKTVNLSRAGGEAPLVVSATIGYDTAWRHVEAMLLEAARRTADVAPIPAPVVLVRSLEDHAIAYELRATPTVPHERIRILSVLHGHVLDVFNEQGVQVMSPHYVMDPEAPKLAPPPAPPPREPAE